LNSEYCVRSDSLKERADYARSKRLHTSLGALRAHSAQELRIEYAQDTTANC